jgi:hypothetical protein
MAQAGTRGLRRGAHEERAGSPALKLGLLVFGLLAMVAIGLDMTMVHQRLPRATISVETEVQSILLGLNGPRYVDPNGRFSIVCPPGWRIIVSPDSSPYDVVLSSPRGAEISILASPVAYDDLPSLMADIEKAERGFNLHTQKEPIFFQDTPAVRRVCQLLQTKLLAIDFVSDRVAHHIMCSVPPECFDPYYSAFLELLNTYRFRSSVTGASAEVSR